MRTVLYILTTFSVIGLAFWAYRENYATQQALSDADDLRYEIREAYSRLAVLKAEKIHHNFLEALQREKWSEQMPTNALLISGPSKTADIEQTLVYGVHGPSQLVVFVIQSH